MAIPEHVKRQAMSAVNHRETTALIRAYGAKSVPEGNLFTHHQPSGPENRPLTEEAKRQAIDAVSNRETTSQIRLVKDTGQVTPPSTPARGADRVAAKVSQLHRSGHGADFAHKTITQDGFGRELHG